MKETIEVETLIKDLITEFSLVNTENLKTYKDVKKLFRTLAIVDFDMYKELCSLKGEEICQ